MIQVENLYAGYGKIEALHGISFYVKRGEIVTLIGANGAGKSTRRCIWSWPQVTTAANLLLFPVAETNGEPVHFTAQNQGKFHNAD